MISDSYSYLLHAAMLFTGGDMLLLIAAILAAHRKAIFDTPKIAVAAKICGGLALFLVLMAAGLHFVFGHSTTSDAPMHLGAFLLAHPAVMAIAALGVLIIWLAWQDHERSN